MENTINKQQKEVDNLAYEMRMESKNCIKLLQEKIRAKLRLEVIRELSGSVEIDELIHQKIGSLSGDELNYKLKDMDYKLSRLKGNLVILEKRIEASEKYINYLITVGSKCKSELIFTSAYNNTVLCLQSYLRYKLSDEKSMDSFMERKTAFRKSLILTPNDGKTKLRLQKSLEDKISFRDEIFQEVEAIKENIREEEGLFERKYQKYRDLPLDEPNAINIIESIFKLFIEIDDISNCIELKEKTKSKQDESIPKLKGHISGKTVIEKALVEQCFEDVCYKISDNTYII